MFNSYLAELVADAVLESGTYAGGDAVGYYAVALVSGTFAVGENIQVSSVTKSVVKTLANQAGASTDALDDTYEQAAEERARGDITVVPGAGNMRGVWVYNGNIYAFRDNAGSTACVMHKASTSGQNEISSYLTLSTFIGKRSPSRPVVSPAAFPGMGNNRAVSGLLS